MNNDLGDNSNEAQRAWAKSGTTRLSLIDHSIDVGAVAEAILCLPTIRARLGSLALRALTDVDVARFAFFASLHDLGKVNHGFQNRLREKRPFAGHIATVCPILCNRPTTLQEFKLRTSLRKALGVDHWETWFADEDDEVELWNSVLAHHGTLPNISGRSANLRLWSPDGEYDPLGELDSVSTAVVRMFCSAFNKPHHAPLPTNARLLNAFAGLVTLADWLGSDHTVFRPPHGDIPAGIARIHWARRQAKDLLLRRWLNPDKAREVARSLRLDFRTLFPDLEVPRPAQKAMLRDPLPDPGQILILEAETGAGKTEAALIHFLRLFRTGRIDGLYFALPTRAAAIQIHGRIQTIVQRWFQNAAPPVGLAVPGYLRVDDQEGNPLPDSHKVLWPDNADRDRAWAVEHAKRYMSGAIMVGTVDQALMGALRVRHAPFRSGPLLRLLLCIDEVHASDAYMTTLVRNVLDQHSASGGHALLMSATLGSSARARLMSRRVDRRTLLRPAKAKAQPFPSLARDGRSLQRLESDAHTKHVTVEILNVDSATESLLIRLTKAAQAGAAVLFIRNSVRDAQQAVRSLEALDTKLLSVSGRIAPHHGRFAPRDRRLLDAALESAFSSKEREGIIAVTTQTAEQSLDICADWLVTDLAPGDVLLQRIGRLHRHSRKRPRGFSVPRVTIIAPSPERLAQCISPKTGAVAQKTILGLGSVYENLVGVLATRDWLLQSDQIRIPGDNRELVETCTHLEQLQRFAERLGDPWERHLQFVDGTVIALGQGAASVAFRWDDSLSFNQPVADMHVQTRLGLKNRLLRLHEPVSGPFGSYVRSLVIPGWMVKDQSADENIEILDQASGAINFRIGGYRFRYDRYGLDLLKNQSARH